MKKTALILSLMALSASLAVASERDTLQEILITATKRTLPLESAPLSVHAISSEELERTGAREFRDYIGHVAGTSFGDVGLADAKLVVRGISTDVYSEVRALTAVYLDEVPVTHPGTHFIVQSSVNPLLVDVERVEVLRGPQGTLHGASSMGGAVRILTRKPDPTAFAGSARGVVSSTEHGSSAYELDGMVNLPMSVGSAVRLVGYQREAAGFIDNVGTGEENVNGDLLSGGRLALRVQPSSRWQVDAKVAHQSRSTDGLNIANVALDRYEQLTSIDESWDDDWTVVDLVLTYDLGWGEILSSTSYQDRRWRAIGDVSGFFDFFAASGTAIAYHTQALGEYVQEVRLASTGEKRMQWLAGVFFSERDMTWRMSFPAPGFDASTGGLASAFGNPDNLGTGTTRFDHEEMAVFGEAEYRLDEQWRIALGGRAFRIAERSNLEQLGLFAGGAANRTNEADETGFAPKLAVAWRPTESTTAYATIARGFRPGGPNFIPVPDQICAESLAGIGLAAVPAVYESDSLWSYEIGVRSRWLDGRLRTTAAAYHVDWTDVQILAFLSCGAGFMANAAEARSDGGEMELSFRPGESLELALNAAYIDARLTSDAFTVGARAGSALPGVPRFSGNASVTWWFVTSPRLHAFLRGDVMHVGRTHGTFVPEGAARLNAPSYELLDLRLGVESRTWNAALFVTNLTDEYAVVNTVDDFGLHPGGDWHNLVRPRTVGVSVAVSLD